MFELGDETGDHDDFVDDMKIWEALDRYYERFLECCDDDDIDYIFQPYP